MTAHRGGAKIYFKRDELNHTGAHKVNNVLGQIMLARRMAKPRVIAETGAGQHGVATATLCARFGLKCVVYMGSVDVERQKPNVFRMQMLGAEVRPVESGSKTLKDAMNEALRDWVTNVADTFYCIGTVAGPHPYPMMVRDFQSIIGKETREQMLAAEGRLPNSLIACIGGGSNAMGLFHPFLDEPGIEIYGVEAAGHGLDTGLHAASITGGRPGVLHGNRTYLLMDGDGQINEAHFMSTLNDQAGSTVSVQRQTNPKQLCLLVRGELDWIVMKALEKDRSRRYETANGLRYGPGRHPADEPVQACPPSAGVPTAKVRTSKQGSVGDRVGCRPGHAGRGRQHRLDGGDEAVQRTESANSAMETLTLARGFIGDNKLDLYATRVGRGQGANWRPPGLNAECRARTRPP